MKIKIFFSLIVAAVILSGLFLSCRKADTNLNTSDSITPNITLNGDESIVIAYGTTTTDPGATAIDNKDGDITANIVSDWNAKVNVNTCGNYIVTYSVRDNAGNPTSRPRFVTVKFLAANYIGNYNASYTVSGAGTSTASAGVTNGTGTNEVILNPFQGPGGFQMKMTLTGSFGEGVTVDQVEPNGDKYNGTGTIGNAGNTINLNITRTNITSTTNIITVLTRN